MALQSTARINGSQKFVWSTIYVAIFVLAPLVLAIFLFDLLGHYLAQDQAFALASDLVFQTEPTIEHLVTGLIVSLFGVYLYIPIVIGALASLAWSIFYRKGVSGRVSGPLDAADAVSWLRVVWIFSLVVSILAYAALFLYNVHQILQSIPLGNRISVPSSLVGIEIIDAFIQIIIDVLGVYDWLSFSLLVLTAVIVVHGLAVLAFSVVLKGAHRIFPSISLPLVPGGMVLTNAVQGLVRLSSGALDAAVDNRFHDLAHEMWKREGRR
ncbi:MAG: hypothetical protein GC191_12560 [Azospirillum sp.]|nr:hypothetical protein [Azospirillum sp.]